MQILKELYAPNRSMQEFQKEFSKERIIALYKKKKEQLTKEDLVLAKKIERAIEIVKTGNALFIRMNQYIVEHYLNKKDTFTKKDIQFVKVALKYLGISPSFIRMVIGFLVKQVESREKSTTKEVEKTTTTIRKKSSISRKEYNVFYKEAMCLYDIQNHKTIKALTQQDIIYLVSLLLKLNITEIEIKQCIQDILWHGPNPYQNAYEAFYDYQDKIENHQENAEVANVLQNIKEYIEATETEEDAAIWNCEIAEELKRIKYIINQDDNYELELGRKLYLTNKEKEENGQSQN